MVYYICSGWYFDVDIKIVPLRPAESFLFLMTWLRTRVLVLRDASAKHRSIRLIVSWLAQ